MEEQIKKFQNKYHLNADQIKLIALPAQGRRFVLDGIIYEVKFTRANPSRFSAEPVGALKMLDNTEPTKEQPLTNDQQQSST